MSLRPCFIVYFVVLIVVLCLTFWLVCFIWICLFWAIDRRFACVYEMV